VSNNFSRDFSSQDFQNMYKLYKFLNFCQKKHSLELYKRIFDKPKNEHIIIISMNFILSDSMEETTNQVIEWTSGSEWFTIESLNSDLAKIEHEVELDNELHLFENSREIESMMEKNKFFSDAFSIESELHHWLHEVPESKYEGFEFSVGRFIILPILMKIMKQNKNSSNWKIHITNFQSSITSLQLNNPTVIQQLYSSLSLPKTNNTNKLLSLMRSNTSFMKWRTSQRLERSVSTPIKEASISFAKQYNEIKESWIPTTKETLSWFRDNVKNSWWGVAWVISAWNMADNKSKSKLTWLWAGLLLSWSYGLWKLFTEKKRKGFSKVSWFFGDLARWSLLWGWWWILAMYFFEKYKTPELSFEDSLKAVEMEVRNQISEKDIKRSMWNISYDNQVWWIKSYNKYVTPIDKNTKQIHWLNITFESHKSLIHAANLINYIKHRYKWAWSSKEPFHPSKNTGDIYIENLNWEEEIISWWWMSTLSTICPEIDDSYNTKIILCSYLNEIEDPKWYQWDQDHFEPATNNIETAINTSLVLLEKTKKEERNWNARLIDYDLTLWSEKDVCTIKSRDRESIFHIKKDPQWIPIELEIPWCEWFKLTTSGWSFHNHETAEEMIVEWVLLANYINFLTNRFMHWCKEINPFEYKNGVQSTWIYVNKKENWIFDTQVLVNTLASKKKFPTLMKSLKTSYSNWKESPFLTYINAMQESDWSSLRT